MTFSLSSLRSVVPHIVRDLGLEVIDPDGSGGVNVLADKDAVRVAMRLPRELMIIEAELDGVAIKRDPNSVLDLLYAARDRLFAQVLAHIAEHGDTRVKQLEGALGEALALIDSRILAYGPDEYAAAARLRVIQRGT